MVDLFAALFLISLLGLIIGLVNPKLVIRWGTIKTRGRVTLIYGSAIIVLFILTGITGSQKRKQMQNATTTTKTVEKSNKENTKDAAHATSKKQIEQTSEPVSSTPPKDRTAIITDQSGEIFEVKSLEYNEPGTRDQLYRDLLSQSSRDFLILHTKTFKIAIPFIHIISVETKVGKRAVLYKYKGTEIKLSGTLKNGTFNGKTEFGNLKLESERLVRLTYKDPPGPTIKRKSRKYSYDDVYTFRWIKRSCF